MLLALSALPPASLVVDANLPEVAIDAAPDDAYGDDAADRDAPHPTVAPDDADATSIKDRWRRARLLRGQGAFQRAVEECLAIAAARDATWSPIALVEAIRIYKGPLADPEEALVLA